jgi:hypothetical protein
MTVKPIELFGDQERLSDIVDRETINIESIVVENWFAHHCPIRVGVRVPDCALSTSTIYSTPERLKSRGNGDWVTNYRNALPVAPVHFVVLAFGSGSEMAASDR